MTSNEAHDYRLGQAAKLIEQFVRDNPELNLTETSPGVWQAVPLEPEDGGR